MGVLRYLVAGIWRQSGSLFFQVSDHFPSIFWVTRVNLKKSILKLFNLCFCCFCSVLHLGTVHTLLIIVSHILKKIVYIRRKGRLVFEEKGVFDIKTVMRFAPNCQHYITKERYADSWCFLKTPLRKRIEFRYSGCWWLPNNIN